MEQARSNPHPLVYTLLIVPFGASGGFVTVMLTFMASRHGLGETLVATLTAVSMFPQTWKFLFAPIADTTLTRKTWYYLACAVVALGTLLTGAIPLTEANFNLLRGVIFLTSVASAFLGMAVEGLMAHLTPAEQRGRVGGWFQAGNLGGAGMGGGLGLYVATHVNVPWEAPAGSLLANTDLGTTASGLLMGVIFVACSAALRWLPDVAAEGQEGGPVGAVRAVVGDLWGMIKTRQGLLAAILCFLPISTGAAMGVMAQAEVAAKWGAGEDEVGFVNGLFSGFLSAIGCVVGGQLCGRWDSRMVYAGVGVLMAGITLLWAFLPMNTQVFIGMGLTYSFAVGLAYAAFTGFVLEAMGGGAAATKYNIFASLSNTPIAYMGVVLAAVVEQYDARTMLLAETGTGIAGILVLAVVASLLLRPKTAV